MSLEKWMPHIEAWSRSELSKAKYAHQHKISYSQFIYWSRKHEQNSRQQPGDLIPVKLTEPHLNGTASVNSHQSLGVLEYPSGVKLVIHHPDLLKSLPDRGV